MSDFGKGETIFLDTEPLYMLFVAENSEYLSEEAKSQDSTRTFQYGQGPKTIEELREEGVKLICPTIILDELRNRLTNEGRGDAEAQKQKVQKLEFLSFETPSEEDEERGRKIESDFAGIDLRDLDSTDRTLAGMIKNRESQGGTVKLYTFDRQFEKISIRIFEPGRS